MPALQHFHACHADTRITMLSRPFLEPLWAMHDAVDATIPLVPTVAGMREAIAQVRQAGPQTAFLFPNSWRSALVPFFGRVPCRIGQQGHHRGILLTTTTPLSGRASNGHQQWEYVDILQLEQVNELPAPALRVPESITQALHDRMPDTAGTPWVAIIPGAARGPSKQWPAGHFIEAARHIAEQSACGFLILGTEAEIQLCESIAAKLGGSATSLAGKTTLPEFTAALSQCSVTLCNDSGGMHLSAAVGTPVVAIYGITDAAKTGPLGPGHALICAEGVTASRSVPRDSQEARDALQSIPPERVAHAALNTLNSNQHPASSNQQPA